MREDNLPSGKRSLGSFWAVTLLIVSSLSLATGADAAHDGGSSIHEGAPGDEGPPGNHTTPPPGNYSGNPGNHTTPPPGNYSGNPGNHTTPPPGNYSGNPGNHTTPPPGNYSGNPGNHTTPPPGNYSGNPGNHTGGSSNHTAPAGHEAQSPGNSTLAPGNHTGPGNADLPIIAVPDVHLGGPVSGPGNNSQPGDPPGGAGSTHSPHHKGGDPGPGKHHEAPPANRFGGVVTITILHGTTPVGSTADVFAMPTANHGSAAGACNPPQGHNESTYVLGSCSGGQANSTGVATIGGLADGTYDLNVFEFTSGTSLFLPAHFTIAGASTTAATDVVINVTLPSPGWITGLVTDDSAEPVANASVEVFGEGWGQTLTGSDGRFNLSVSPGRFGIFINPPSEASLRSYNPPCDPFGQANGDACVTVLAGQATALATIELAGGSALRGRIVDTDGNTLSGDINVFSICEDHGKGPAGTAASPGGPHDGPGGGEPGIPPAGEHGGPGGPATGPGAQPAAHSCQPSFGHAYVSESDDGNFTVGGLSVGHYILEAFIRVDGQEQRVVKTGIQVVQGNTTEVGTVVVGGGSVVQGTIVGSGEDVHIMVFQGTFLPGRQPGFPLGFAESRDGAFRLAGLPAGNVTVVVEPPYGSPYKRSSHTLNLVDQETHWLNVTLDAGQALRGTVTDPAGDPIVGADVSAFLMGPCNPTQQCGGFGRSSDDGSYVLGGLSPGSFGLFVGPPPGLGLGAFMMDPHSGSSLTISDGAMTTWFNVTLARGGEIRGNVTAAESTSSIWVNAYGPSGFASAPVASDGAFRLEGLPAGAYTLRAESPPGSNLAPMEVAGVSVASGAATWHNLSMSSGACLTGRALDENSAPVVQAFVNAFELIPPGSKRMGGFGHTITAGDGTFSLCGLTAGSYGLRVEPPFGASGSAIEQIGISVEDADVALGDLSMQPGAAVTGTVLGPANGTVMGFVGIWSPQGGAGGGAPINPDGSFNVSVPPGTYNIEIFPDPFSNGDLGGLHLDGQVVGVSGLNLGNLTLAAGGTLQGRLLDVAGDPVAFAFVNAKGDSGGFGFSSTGPDGRFQMPGLAFTAGQRVDLFVDAPPGSNSVGTMSSLTWAPNGNGTHAAGDITLSTGQDLTGTVLRLAGNTSAPVAGATVDVWPSNPTPFGGRHATTNADGTFAVYGLPDGDYDLAVHTTSGAGAFFPAHVTVAGAAANTTLNLASDATLTVTVSNGAPVAGADVEAFNPATNAGAQGITDGDGDVELALPPGTYTVRTKAAGSQPQVIHNVSVAAGSNALAVTMTTLSAGTLAGSAQNGSVAVANATVVAIHQQDRYLTMFAQTNSAGNFTLTDVPVGPYDVFLSVLGEEYGCTTATVTPLATTATGVLDAATRCGGSS